MHTVLVLAVIVMFCQAFLLTTKQECQTSGDCPNTHCCVTDFRGQYCFHYQNKSQPCHLDGHSMLLYKCGCTAGHTFQQFQLDPSHSLPDPNGTIHQAEVILANGGFGICVPSQ